MSKIGFYVKTSGVGDVDCRAVSSGNPGIGGTEYEFILIASLLARGGKFEVVFFSDGPLVFPDGLRIVNVSGGTEGLIYSFCQEECQIVVLDAKFPSSELRAVNEAGVDFVLWEHLFPNFKKLNFLDGLNHLKALVCVGREQLDLFRDHRIYRKSTYIYNACCFSKEVNQKALSHTFSSRRKSVVFMGALTPNKGFHLLADVWKRIVEKEPDAQLHVIGSGALYSKGAKLGCMGLAEAEYEHRFIEPLLDDKGLILPSVHFYGVLGFEKWDVLCQMKVGIPNPSGISETFGISAVEMMKAGTLVVTQKCPGFLDVLYRTGSFYSSKQTLDDLICQKLNETSNDLENCHCFLEEKFGAESVLAKWENLLVALIAGDLIEQERGLVNLRFRRKWMREFNRRCFRILFFGLPLLRYEELWLGLKRKLFCRKKSVI